MAGGTFVWPPPRMSTVRQRWPYAQQLAASGPAHEAGLRWLEEIALAVLTERKRRGWTREALVTASGLSLNAVKEFETGQRWPSWQTVATLCHVLDLDISVEHARHTSN